jgi:hypothetical protein
MAEFKLSMRRLKGLTQAELRSKGRPADGSSFGRLPGQNKRDLARGKQDKFMKAGGWKVSAFPLRGLG